MNANDIVWDDAPNASDIVWDDDKKKRAFAQSAARAGGLGVRDVIEGLAGSAASIIGDPVNTAINYGIRGVNELGGNVPELGMPSQALRRGLDATGLPSPESGPEQFTSSVNRAVVGFGPWVKGAQMAGTAAQSAPLLRSLVNKPIAETAAVATGAGASDLTRQAGGNEFAQLVAGAVAPMGMSAVGDVTRRGATAINEIRRPLTQKGSQQIAADVIGRTAQDKSRALQNLDRYNRLQESGATVGVPGSRPTAAAVAGDYGLSGGQQLISRGDANPLFANQFAGNNEARIADLAKLKATDDMLAFYQQKRDAITAPMRAKVFEDATQPVDYGRVDGLIAALRNSPAGGRAESARALDTLRGWVQERAKEGRVSPEDAYALHQDINVLIQGKLSDSQGQIRLAKGFATSIKKELADVIEDVAPGFKKYLEKYSRLSNPIDRLEILKNRLGGDELSKVTNAGTQVTDSGAAYTVSQAKVRDARKNILADLKKEGLSLAPRQSDIVNRVLGDLNSEQFALRGGKQPGSDTYQNIAAANFMSRVLGDTLAQSGVGRLAQSPLNLLNKPFESRINDLVIRAYQDPKLMEELLRKARTNRGSPQLSGLLNQGRAGLIGSVLSQ